ncbi:hypothetical protein KCP75_12560 [Salmonella enterica subsp. enterica]|nr:hypothetical protein KCP75_12560 [Salmonella enterica subsp. enterica]
MTTRLLRYWVGCANELNAAYTAASLCAYVGAGALLTTFWRGENLALLTVSRAKLREYVPVLHNVGAFCSCAAAWRIDAPFHAPATAISVSFYRMSFRLIPVASAILDEQNACFGD